MQLVLQDPFASLNPVHTCATSWAAPCTSTAYAGDDLERAIRDLLRRVALEPAEQFIDKFPHELSGGQRQRVVDRPRRSPCEPKVLLADEPVSMLDVSIRLGVLNLLADLRDRDGLAILYVTHDIASARYLADTIMVMYAGRVVEVGPGRRRSPTRPRTRTPKLLLSAAPDPDADQKTWLGQRGAPPSLVTPPSGCRFHPRCPFAMAICSTDAPPMLTGHDGHQSACWLLADSAAEPAAAGPSQLRSPRALRSGSRTMRSDVAPRSCAKRGSRSDQALPRLTSRASCPTRALTATGFAYLGRSCVLATEAVMPTAQKIPSTRSSARDDRPASRGLHASQIPSGAPARAPCSRAIACSSSGSRLCQYERSASTAAPRQRQRPQRRASSLDTGISGSAAPSAAATADVVARHDGTTQGTKRSPSRTTRSRRWRTTSTRSTERLGYKLTSRACSTSPC